MENDRPFESMKYKMRGDGPLQGRPRVFFCCAAADFKRLFEPVTEEILSIRRNAVIWYVDPDEGTVEGEVFLEELSQVQLLVVPVTTAFLRQDKPDPARTVAFAYAIENGIPVLPIMQEAGLEQIFNEICGNLMVLDRTAQQQDLTAVPYEEKLKRFLEGVLVSDELTKRVKDAFDAFIFLSYRKKDRASAQKIMRLLHENAFCRDVAIWYDEFLKPGEDFNEAIFEMIEKSALYTLVVTERLLDTPNYVQLTEYQEALRQNKPILPLEVRTTARDQLKRLYDNIPECLKTEDHTKIAETLHEILCSAKDATLRENNTPEHTFLIGIAYLSGIFVEVDHDQGVKLITEAADAGLPEALEKLVTMYQTGEGVERNDHTAIAWQERLAEWCYNATIETPTDQNLDEYFLTLTNLCRMQLDAKETGMAEKTAFSMRSCAESMQELKQTKAKKAMFISYVMTGDVYRQRDRFEEAMEWYHKSVKLGEILTNSKTIDEYLNLSSVYVNMGDICAQLDRFYDAEHWYLKNRDICETLVQETTAAPIRKALAVSYDRMGYACLNRDSLSATAWFWDAMFLAEKIAEETDALEDIINLSVSYINIAKVCECLEETEGAKMWYQKNMMFCEKLVEEHDTIGALDALAYSYYSLVSLLTLPSKEKKRHLIQLKQLGNELLKRAVLPKYQAYIDYATQELAAIADVD